MDQKEYIRIKHMVTFFLGLGFQIVEDTVALNLNNLKARHLIKWQNICPFFLITLSYFPAQNKLLYSFRPKERLDPVNDFGYIKGTRIKSRDRFLLEALNKEFKPIILDRTFKSYEAVLEFLRSKFSESFKFQIAEFSALGVNLQRLYITIFESLIPPDHEIASFILEELIRKNSKEIKNGSVSGRDILRIMEKFSPIKTEEKKLERKKRLTQYIAKQRNLRIVK